MVTRLGLPRNPRWIARAVLGTACVLCLAALLLLSACPLSNTGARSTGLDLSSFRTISGILERPRKTASDSCVLSSPSEADLRTLRAGERAGWTSGSSQAEGESSLLSCQVQEPCQWTDDSPPPVSCEAASCRALRLVRAGDLVGEILRVSELEKRLRGTVSVRAQSGPVRWEYEAYCLGGQDSIEVPVLIHLTVLPQSCPPPPCQAPSPPPVDVHIFFVRFLSRHGLLNTMEHLPSVLTDVARRGLVFDFQKYQIQEFKDIKNLKTLFGGNARHATHRPGRGSLVDVAASCCFQTTLLELGCFRPASSAKYLRSLAEKKYTPSLTFLQNQDACNFTLGSDQSDELLFYDALHRALSKAHGVSGGRVLREALQTRCADVKAGRKLFISLLEMDVQQDGREKPWAVDLALADVIREVSRRQNAVVVLLSDVGHPSLPRAASSVFLRTQVANPFFYLVLPETVASYLGPHVVKSLRKNSAKLLTLNDIHETLRELFLLVENHYSSNGSDANSLLRKVNSNSSTLRGLPTENVNARKNERESDQRVGVSALTSELPTRSCEDLGVMPPGLCLCEGQAVTYPNDSLQVSVAEFALGTWSNLLMDELDLHEGHNAAALDLKSCLLLRGYSFSRVRVRWVGSIIRVSLAISARYGTMNITFANVTVDLAPQQEGYLLASVEPHPSLGSIRNVCRQLSRFSSLEKGSSSSDVRFMTFPFRLSFGALATPVRVHEDCLYVFVRSFKGTAVFEGYNDCHDRAYDVTFDVSLINMVSMVELPVEQYIGCGEIRMLTVVRKQSYVTRLFSHKHHVHFKITYFQ